MKCGIVLLMMLGVCYAVPQMMMMHRPRMGMMGMGMPIMGTPIMGQPFMMMRAKRDSPAPVDTSKSLPDTTLPPTTLPPTTLPPTTLPLLNQTTTLKPLLAKPKPKSGQIHTISARDTMEKMPLPKPAAGEPISRTRRAVEKEEVLPTTPKATTTTTTTSTEFPPKKVRATNPHKSDLPIETKEVEMEKLIENKDVKVLKRRELAPTVKTTLPPPTEDHHEKEGEPDLHEKEGDDLHEKEGDDKEKGEAIKPLDKDKEKKPALAPEKYGSELKKEEYDEKKPVDKQRRDTADLKLTQEKEGITKDIEQKPLDSAVTATKQRRATPEIPTDDVKPAKESTKPALEMQADQPLLKTESVERPQELEASLVLKPESELNKDKMVKRDAGNLEKKVEVEDAKLPLLTEGKGTTTTAAAARTRRSSYGGSSSRVSFAIREAPLSHSSDYAAPARIETPIRAAYGSRVRSEYQAPAVRSEYQAPAVRSEYQAPAVRSEYQAPALRSEYQAPAVRSEYQAPAVRSEYQAPAVRSSYQTVREEVPIRSSYQTVVREIVREVIPVRSSSYETVREVPRRPSYETVREEVPVRESRYETVREEAPLRSAYAEETTQAPIRIRMDSYQPSQVRESSRYRRDVGKEGGHMKLKLGPGMMFKGKV